MFSTAKNRPLFVLLASLLILGSCSRQKPNSISGRVVRIVDGDTITILDANSVQHKIRLKGIDAPERRQDFSSVARENLGTLAFQKEAIVDYSKTDRWGRLVGLVWINGQDVCLEQIKAGLAWHFKKYQKEQSPEDRKVYSGAEEEARQAKRGLWADPNPIPPWDYRRHTNGSEEETDSSEDNQPSNTNSSPTRKPSLNAISKLNGETIFQARKEGNSAAASDATIQTRNNHSAEVLGNRRTMIYHWPGCPYYDAITPHNRVHFQTREEAERAGYRAARNCP